MRAQGSEVGVGLGRIPLPCRMRATSRDPWVCHSLPHGPLACFPFGKLGLRPEQEPRWSKKSRLTCRSGAQRCPPTPRRSLSQVGRGAASGCATVAGFRDLPSISPLGLPMVEVRKPQRNRRCLRRVLTVVATSTALTSGVVLPLSSLSAAAVPPNWQVTATFNPAFGAKAVSCPSASTCVAVGLDMTARTTDGGVSWTEAALRGVSPDVGRTIFQTWSTCRAPRRSSALPWATGMVPKPLPTHLRDRRTAGSSRSATTEASPGQIR